MLPEPAARRFGKYMGAVRRARALPIEAVAAAADISVDDAIALEGTGRRGPNGPHLARYADALGISSQATVYYLRDNDVLRARVRELRAGTGPSYRHHRARRQAAVTRAHDALRTAQQGGIPSPSTPSAERPAA